MQDGNDPAGGKVKVLKTEPHINEDGTQRENDRQDSGFAQGLADNRADVFYAQNLKFIVREQRLKFF